jgi:hypothetical protein
MSTPQERAHDLWARAYLVATLHRDTEALICLLSNVDPATSWDRLDATAAVARDTILALTDAETAAAVLSRRLVADALASARMASGDDATQSDGHG